jgi:uncharacterized hydrophobic protein (TIGR00271 family)
MANVAAALRSMPGARHVMRTADDDAPGALVTAYLVDDAVDGALRHLRRLGVAPEDTVLVRLDSIGQSAAERPLASVVWSDLLSQAGANARPFPRYLMFMVAAAVVAAFGVIYANTTLVVGAMAISPDTLPITAAATALVLGRWLLAGRALLALICGLAIVCVLSGILTFVLNQLALLPADFQVGKGGFLDGLSTVNVSTPLVALAAGMAAILALETRASSAVGVAISVTTIPASAYLGVAAGVGEVGKAAGALLVLVINVAMLLVGGYLTLLAQRGLGAVESKRSAHDRDDPGSLDGALDLPTGTEAP